MYSRGSDQLVNRDKSAVFFSSNCSDEMKTVIRQVLHIEKEALTERYLGLPTAVGRSSTDAFEYIPARIRSLIGTWSGREASCARREVLLKSVAQAVPTYSMSCFLLPGEICKNAIGHHQLLVGKFCRQSTYTLAKMGQVGKVKS